MARKMSSRSAVFRRIRFGRGEELFHFGEGAVAMIRPWCKIPILARGFRLRPDTGGRAARRALRGELFDAVCTSRRDSGFSPVVGSSRKNHRRIPDEADGDVQAAAHACRYVATLGPPRQRAEPPSGHRDLAASFRCRSRATSTRFSRPVRISSTVANCPVRPIDFRTLAHCVVTSKLSSDHPRSALSSVDKYHDVVLPAPFEPSRAKMLPRATSKSTPRSTAVPCTTSRDPARRSPRWQCRQRDFVHRCLLPRARDGVGQPLPLTSGE